MSLAWRRRAVSALVFVTCVGGCATKLDFDKVSRGSRPPDASTDPLDAAHALPLLDAGPDSEADRDVAQPLDVPDAQRLPEVSFSCAALSPAPTFCDDFEGSDPLSQFSDYGAYPATPASGAITVDGTAARAGRRSMLVTVYDGDTACNDCVAVVGGVNLDAFATHTTISVEFDMLVDQIDPGMGRRVVLFQLEFGSEADGSNQHTLVLESQGTRVNAGFVEFANAGTASHARVSRSEQHEYPFQAGPALGQWAHVRYTLDTVPDDNTMDLATLSVDDSVLFIGAPYLLQTEKLPRVEVGVAWVDASLFTDQDEGKSWQVRYDDVVVQVETSTR